MELRKEIKKILVEQEMSMSELARKMAEKTGGSSSVQNLSAKLGKNTMAFRELELMLGILGYSVEFKKL